MDKQKQTTDSDHIDRPQNERNRRTGLEDDRRQDGTKGDLDLDKDAATHKQKKEEDHPGESRGTGIPGFGV
jgi:hypothetical protein